MENDTRLLEFWFNITCFSIFLTLWTSSRSSFLLWNGKKTLKLRTKKVHKDITEILCSRNFQNMKFDAWLCWNLIALPSLRFCVKSNFGIFAQFKNVIFSNFRGSESWFLVNVSNCQVPNLPNVKVKSL